MELDTLTMDRTAAREAFLDYRRAFAADHAAIDGELMRGYKALAAGKTLIYLSRTITAGGVDAVGRPKLAIGRADEPRVTFERHRQGSVTFSPNIDWRNRRVRAEDRVIRLGDGTLPEGLFIGAGDWAAIMPVIPPRLRPPYDLSGYHVLWEAAWTKPTTRRAPHDPALLKRIGGDVFAVLAVWDLTDLERAVLELRRS